MIFKTCPCCLTAYTFEEWSRLGPEFWEGFDLDIAHCTTCRSTMAVEPTDTILTLAYLEKK